MIISILIILLAFTWLLLETDYLRIRLLIGSIAPVVDNQADVKPETIPDTTKTDKQPILCFDCDMKGSCRNRKNRSIGYKIPEKTLHLFNHTQHFMEGCNFKRSQVIRDLYRIQKGLNVSVTPEIDKWSKRRMATPTPGFIPEYGSIEILVDNELMFSKNGDNKAGLVKAFMRSQSSKKKVKANG